MEITERDLEDFIFNDLKFENGSGLQERGLNTFLISSCIPNRIQWHRQVSLQDYGIADLIGIARHQGQIHIEIIELKNKPIESNDFDQLFRYRTAVKEILENSYKDRFSTTVTSILVGPSIKSGHYIHNHTVARVFTFDFGITGFNFKYQANRWCRDAGELHIENTRSGDKFMLNDFTEQFNG